MKASITETFFGAWLLCIPSLLFAREPIRITADLTDHKRGIFHAHMVFPVEAGPIELGYPKWIPGEHSPSGALNQIIGLRFRASGKALTWRRDEVEIYDFHLEIPAGVHQLEADLDFATADLDDGFSATVAASDNAAVLNWWQVVLFPVSQSADAIRIEPQLLIPPGWKAGTALPIASQRENLIQFAPVSLRTLVDSPVLTGRYFRSIAIGAVTPVELDLAGESERAIAITPEEVRHFQRLTAEAEALFGGAPYRDYHLLLCLSNPLAHYTLEHAASSDNRFVENALYDPQTLVTTASTIPHEYLHAWNGKARTPSGLAILNYQQPMKGELIWVYEGLTEYLGKVLTTRSGFWTAEQFREALALDAGEMATHPGRQWRSLRDTAIGVQLLSTAPSSWLTERRSTDFYSEGALIWMEADTILHTRSQGKRSLDDFCKAFLAPAIQGSSSTYTFEDIVRLMNQIQPYDWQKFFTERLSSTAPEPPTAGITAAGWKLAYSADETSIIHDLQAVHKTDLLWPLWSREATVDARFSIGLLLSADGTILDASRDMAGFKAGLSPGMRILSVNAQPFSPDSFRSALKATVTGGSLSMVRVHNGVQATVSLDYHDGERFPTLLREPDRPDLLSSILAPRSLK